MAATTESGAARAADGVDLVLLGPKEAGVLVGRRFHA
jgi:hypothetical protein